MEECNVNSESRFFNDGLRDHVRHVEKILRYHRPWHRIQHAILNFWNLGTWIFIRFLFLQRISNPEAEKQRMDIGYRYRRWVWDVSLDACVRIYVCTYRSSHNPNPHPQTEGCIFEILVQYKWKMLLCISKLEVGSSWRRVLSRLFTHYNDS